jgi:glycosyltransferase involved in cell wall biosynthesis
LQPDPVGTRRVAPPKLLFLVTEDWYFCSHRLPVARAARDAGFTVLVATRVREHGAAILAEGFALRPIAWKRRRDGFFGHLRALGEIVRLYRSERPDILYHVALKPVLFGGLAARIAFRRDDAPVLVSAIMGLGIGFGATAARWRKVVLGWALKRAVGRGYVITQNSEDRLVLLRLGLDMTRMSVIPGSGVDTEHFVPLPEPGGPGIAAALVGRMLKSKGVVDAVAAVRRLRAEGLAVELFLAGAPDPDSRDSLSEAELTELAREPGIEWLGHVGDVRDVWARAAIALLPSSYGEGLPKSLLEAAACGRPIVASDIPGCREAFDPGTTGLVVPVHDVAALAHAIAALAGDPALRRQMGEAGRALAVSAFAEGMIARETMTIYRAALFERRKRT